jgi:hypothetical protein
MKVRVSIEPLLFRNGNLDSMHVVPVHIGGSDYHPFRLTKILGESLFLSRGNAQIRD